MSGEDIKVGPLYVTAVRMLRHQGRRDYAGAVMWGTVVLLIGSAAMLLVCVIAWVATIF